MVRSGRFISLVTRGLDPQVHPFARINAVVPLATLFGYRNNLSSLSRGQATFEMRFGHYAPVKVPGDDEPFPPAIGMHA